MRESVPRQIDKKSGVPEEEKGIWGSQGGDEGLEFSRRRKGQTFFFPTFLSLSHIKHFFSFKPRADDYTTKLLSLNSVLRILYNNNVSCLRAVSPS